MKIVCISDTHTFGKLVAVPEGDLLIHAGDHTFRGTEGETKAAMKWLESLPHRYKVAVPGNHDFYFDLRYKHGHQYRSWRITRYFKPAALMEHYAPSVKMLIDEGVEIEGLKIYGSPWQPWFWDWAFNLPADVEMLNPLATPAIRHNLQAAQEVWNKIPDDTNILVTHSPPHGILDAIGSKMYDDDDRAGCVELMKRIESLQHLKLHVFGHIHEGYGQHEQDGKLFVNASTCNREYQAINKPIIIEL